MDDPQLLKHYKEMTQVRASFFMPEKTVMQAEKLLDHVLEQR